MTNILLDIRPFFYLFLFLGLPNLIADDTKSEPLSSIKNTDKLFDIACKLQEVKQKYNTELTDIRTPFYRLKDSIMDNRPNYDYANRFLLRNALNNMHTNFSNQHNLYINKITLKSRLLFKIESDIQWFRSKWYSRIKSLEFDVKNEDSLLHRAKKDRYYTQGDRGLIAKLNKRKKNLQKIKKKIEEEYKNLQITRNSFKDNQETLTNKVKDLNSSLSQLEQENNELKNRSSYKKNPETLTNKVKDLNSSLSQLEQENKKLKNRNFYKKNQQRLANKMRTLNSRFTKLEEEYNNLKNMHSSYEQNEQVLIEEINDLKRNRNRLEKRKSLLKDLQSNGNSLATTQKIYSQRMNDLKKRANDLEKANNQIKDRTSSQVKIQQELKEKSNRLEKELSNLESKHTQLKQSNLDLKSTKEKMEKEVTRLEEAKRLNQKVSVLQHTHNQLAQALVARKSREHKGLVVIAISWLVLFTSLIISYTKKIVKSKAKDIADLIE